MQQDRFSALMAEAHAVRRYAYAPYSHFTIGAAVMGLSGQIFTGVNVENASFGLTVCAERNAVFAAVAGGERRLTSVAISAVDPRTKHAVTPCGACLQVMAEFMSDDATIILTDGKSCRLSSLLVAPFRLQNL